MENSNMPRITPDQLIRLMNAKGPPPKLEHGPDFDAVFDPFEFEGEEFFLHYMASIYCWMVRRPHALVDREAPSGDCEDEPTDNDAAMNALAFMPPPAPLEELPSPFEDVPMGLFQGPFWYRGQRFSWVFIPGSDRWQLSFMANRSEAVAEAA